MKFTTEEFVEAVVTDVKKKVKVDPDYVFTLTWSSSGPAAYAISLQEKTQVTGSYVAMSVFVPNKLPALSKAKGRALPGAQPAADEKQSEKPQAEEDLFKGFGFQ